MDAENISSMRSEVSNGSLIEDSKGNADKLKYNGPEKKQKVILQKELQKHLQTFIESIDIIPPLASYTELFQNPFKPEFKNLEIKDQYLDFLVMFQKKITAFSKQMNSKQLLVLNSYIDTLSKSAGVSTFDSVSLMDKEKEQIMNLVQITMQIALLTYIKGGGNILNLKYIYLSQFKNLPELTKIYMYTAALISKPEVLDSLYIRAEKASARVIEKLHSSLKRLK